MVYANSGSCGRGKFDWERIEARSPSPCYVDPPSFRTLRTPVTGKARRTTWRNSVKLLTTVTTALVLSVLVACDQKLTPASKPIVFATSSEPERLDPLTIKNPQTFDVAWQIFEGLVGLTENGELQPRLAKSWETDDQKIWTFHLQPNARFHDSPLFGAETKGRAVTAADVVWTYTAFCSPRAFATFVLADSLKGCADYKAGEANSVSGISAVDERTVRMELLKSEPFLISRLSTAWIAIMPREAYQPEFKDKWGLTLVVGTGPYQLISRSDSEVVLTANENYWNANTKPEIDKLQFRVIKDAQAQLAALKQGEVDLIALSTNLFPTVLDGPMELKSPYSDSFQLKIFPTYNHHLVGLNLDSLPDAHLRRAINFAIDRETIVDEILQGHGDVLSGPIPSIMAGANGGADPHDVERSRRELEQSSYDGETLEFFVHNQRNSELIGQIIQQQLKEVGIDVKLTKRDYGATVGEAINQNGHMYSFFAEIVFSSPEPLLLNLFSSQKIPVPNFWRYQNTQVDESINRLFELSSLTERMSEVQKIVARVTEDIPAAFLFTERHVVLYAKSLENLVVNPHGHYQLEYLRAVP